METIIYKQKTSKVKKKPNQSDMRQKNIYKNIIAGLLLIVGPVRLHWRKQFSFYKWLSIGDNFLLREGSSHLPPLLSAGTPTGLKLCRPCGFICTSVVLCLEGIVSLASSIPSDSYCSSASSSTELSEP